MQQAIAILDSGVGGLTVAKEIMRQLPEEQIVYFGDTRRAPYGSRPPSEVMTYTKQMVDFLLTLQPKMIVIACNTATATALETIREISPVPVVGVIDPGARQSIRLTRSRRIGVIGTEATIRSGAYDKVLKELCPDVQVTSLACPLFVPLVEQGKYRTREAERIVRETLKPLAHADMDCLILGCTHYPFLSEFIAAAMGSGVTLIHSADETAKDVGEILRRKGLANPGTRQEEHRFFCSGDPGMFASIAAEWLGQPVQVTQVTLVDSIIR